MTRHVYLLNFSALNVLVYGKPVAAVDCYPEAAFLLSASA